MGTPMSTAYGVGVIQQPPEPFVMPESPKNLAEMFPTKEQEEYFKFYSKDWSSFPIGSIIYYSGNPPNVKKP